MAGARVPHQPETARLLHQSDCFVSISTIWTSIQWQPRPSQGALSAYNIIPREKTTNYYMDSRVCSETMICCTVQATVHIKVWFHKDRQQWSLRSDAQLCSVYCVLLLLAHSLSSDFSSCNVVSVHDTCNGDLYPSVNQRPRGGVLLYYRGGEWGWSGGGGTKG